MADFGPNPGCDLIPNFILTVQPGSVVSKHAERKSANDHRDSGPTPNHVLSQRIPRIGLSPWSTSKLYIRPRGGYLRLRAQTGQKPSQNRPKPNPKPAQHQPNRPQTGPNVPTVLDSALGARLKCLLRASVCVRCKATGSLISTSGLSWNVGFSERFGP